MARLNDVANIWNTVKELDVRDIREQAEQPCRIALIGERNESRSRIAHILTSGADRFPPRGGSALDVLDLPLTRERGADLGRADLLILVLSGDQALSYDAFLAYEKLAVLPVPLVLVVVGRADLPTPAPSVPTPDWAAAPAVFLAHTDNDETIRKRVGAAIVETLPESLVLAAARRLPGLRAAAARAIIANVSLSNATYAFTTGLSEIIPVLNLPLNAADMIVMTKNQAILVYRIGLAMGADGEFSTMIKEIMPVIGGGFIWRQLARQLVGLIPVVGLLPKVAVSYAGTYATGVVAARWYEHGELLSRAAIQTVMRDALDEGRRRGQALLQSRKNNAAAPIDAAPAILPAPASATKQPNLLRRISRRIRDALPGKRKRAAKPTKPAQSAIVVETTEATE